MSSDTSNLVIGLVTIVVIITLIVLWVRRSNKKTRAQVWTGQVVDKRTSTSTDEDGDSTTYYWLTVAVDGVEKQKKMSVNSGQYAGFNTGDKIEKKLGELQPSKVA
ncbi:MAG: DUF2500 family protein [Candidatus Saccharimonadales bacterium]